MLIDSTEAVELERKEKFFTECVTSFEEFEPGSIYETVAGCRVQCLSNYGDYVEFKGIGVMASDGKRVIKLDRTVYRADKRIHPLSWYAGKKVANAGDQTVWYDALKDNYNPDTETETDPDKKLSTYKKVKQHLDVVKSMTIDDFCAFFTEFCPEIDNTRYDWHLKKFMGKYPTKVTTVEGVLTSACPGLDYEI